MKLPRPDSWRFGVDCLKQTRIVRSIDCLVWRAVIHKDYAITVPKYSQSQKYNEKLNSHCAELLVCLSHKGEMKMFYCSDH